jgi:hypothetical protein
MTIATLIPEPRTYGGKSLLTGARIQSSRTRDIRYIEASRLPMNITDMMCDTQPKLSA